MESFWDGRIGLYSVCYDCNVLKTKIQSQPDELAANLLVFVEKPIGSVTDFHLETDYTSATGKRLLLYQFAAVMTVILEVEQEDSTFATVRMLLTEYFFSPDFGGRLGYEYDEVQNAIGDMCEAINAANSGSGSRLMSWGRRWLNAVGIIEYNPVYLGMFTNCWVLRYSTVKKFVEQIELIT